MSYIVEEPLLQTHLKSWAQDNQILVLTFFFWKAGAEEQRSINGLLRSLLYQLLMGLPSLSEWLPITGAGNVVWTEKRLQNTLEVLLDHKPNNTSICLFIDGLDEFEGHEDAKDTLIKTIKNMTHRSCIKAVVSSRPEPLLLETFSRFSSLRLQDLTGPDMLTFIEEKLLSESRMRELRDIDKPKFRHLVNAIAGRSDGVFLWLDLAMQDMMRGVRARDSIDMLQSRLKGLNRSLDGLFSQLISRIDDVHQALGANYIRLVWFWRSTSHFTGANPTILHLLFAFDSHFSDRMRLVLNNSLDDSNDLYCLRSINDFAASLPLRTGGLLQIQRTNLDFCELYSSNPTDVMCDSLIPARPNTVYGALAANYIHFQQHTSVGFVHRSAYEYVTENDMGKTLLLKALPLNDILVEMFQRSCERCVENTFLFVQAPWYLRYLEHEGLMEPETFNKAISRDVRCMFGAFEYLQKSRQSASRKTYFQFAKKWLSTCVGARMKSIRDSGLLSHETLLNMFPKELDFADVLDNDHVLTMMLIQTEYYEWASETLDGTHSASIDYYMKCALEGHLVWNSQYVEPWRIIPGLKFVHKLLELGLQPNSRGPPTKAGIAGIVRIQPLSHWQHLLTEAINVMQYDGITPDPYYPTRRFVLAIADSFIRLGADPNARILACHTIHFPPPADVTIVAVVSALWAISYLARTLDNRGREEKDAMVERGAKIYCSVISVCERTQHVEAEDDTARRLSFFEEPGEGEVGTWIRGPYWEISQDLTEILKPGLEVPNPPLDFFEIARRVWRENFNRTENLRQSDKELFMALQNSDDLVSDSKADGI